ncbi:MAG: nitroreductase [Planctomycetota bacterium]|nr:MAG: nitroreductase [Planctomycetota bacterium]
MSRRAAAEHPIHDLIAERWSPCGFRDEPVSAEHLRSLFEAARWAASSYNEQPWRFIVATRDQPEQHERVLSCLVEANQAWARRAPVLALAVASRNFTRNGKPNAAAWYDLGQSVATLSLEATARGISVHQMIGILPDRARELFGVPDDHDVATALAIGYAAPPDSLPDEIRARDTAPRTRRPLGEFVFSGSWGRKAEFL